MKPRNLLIIFISLAAIGCGGLKNSKEKEQEKLLEQLATEVMEVHDRSMPEHGQLFKVRKGLMEIYQTTEDTIVKSELQAMLDRIDIADDEMMDWMHNYKVPEDFLPFEEQKNYYEEQLVLIQKVEEKVHTALIEGKQMQEKYGQ